MSKYNIYEFQQFFKSKQDLSKDYLIEKYFKNNKEIENLQSQLQAYKDDNETMAITIRDLNQSHFKILNDLKVHKDKEEKIREYCNNKSQYWGNDSYINGKNEENEEVKNDILQILNEGE